SAGPTGWRSGTSRTPRSVPSRCRSTSRPPCATWRSIGRTYGSRPTAGWCAWRATRRCDEPPPPARPRGRVRPAAPALRPARAGGADGTTLVLSIDLSVEGVHFRTDWLSFREIGWRATAAALSDLAAEAAEPIGVLVSLGVPGNRQRRSGNAAPATEIMAGVGAAARSVGASVLGGDLVRSARYLVDVCVVGWTAHPVRRNGARPGHGIRVRGRP